VAIAKAKIVISWVMGADGCRPAPSLPDFVIHGRSRSEAPSRRPPELLRSPMDPCRDLGLRVQRTRTWTAAALRSPGMDLGSARVAALLASPSDDEVWRSRGTLSRSYGGAMTAIAADLSVSAPSLRRIFSNKPTFVGRI